MAVFSFCVTPNKWPPENVTTSDLLPTEALKHADRRAEHDLGDPRPQDRPLAHTARLRGRVEPEVGPTGIGVLFGKLADCDDLAVPRRILLPLIGPFRHDLARLKVDQQGTEGSLRILSSEFDRAPHI
jgi:hypothetical protein